MIDRITKSVHKNEGVYGRRGGDRELAEPSRAETSLRMTHDEGPRNGLVMIVNDGFHAKRPRKFNGNSTSVKPAELRGGRTASELGTVRHGKYII